MKKILTFALCAFFALFAVGCSFSTSVNLVMDGTQPWEIYTNYEQCVYKVTQKNASGTIIGEGTLTTTVTVNTDINQSTVTSSYTFTTKDSIIPQTDVITSSSTFLTSSCAALKSEKDVQLATNPELNYKFVADYENKKVDYYMNGSEEITKTLVVPDSEKVSLDNEALYYIVRAFNPDEKNEGNFLLTNLYDCYCDGKISSYSVYYRTSDVNLTSETFGGNDTDSWNLFTQNSLINDNKIECYAAKINRNRSNMSGAPIEMWFSKTPFKSGKKRVMIKMKTTMLTIPNAYVDYTIEYDLVSYSTTAPQTV